MDPTILIDLKSSMAVGFSFFGIKVTHVTFRCFSEPPSLKNFVTVSKISSFISSHISLMNLKLKPSNPGALSIPHAHTAFLISYLDGIISRFRACASEIFMWLSMSKSNSGFAS